jgi:hypothetical protein
MSAGSALRSRTGPARVGRPRRALGAQRSQTPPARRDHAGDRAMVIAPQLPSATLPEVFARRILSGPGFGEFARTLRDPHNGAN